MITPLMHVLSCLDKDYKVGPPVSILYLNKSDWELIVQEARRLGSFFEDENKIWISESPTGLRCVAPVQAVAGQSKSLNKYTSLLLTRIWQCYQVYQKELDTIAPTTEGEDLSTDAVVLRLEGNPRFIYTYVYNVMKTLSLSYGNRIAKLTTLLATLKSHTVVQSSEEMDAGLRERLEMQSYASYWRGMLLCDYVKYYGTVPEEFTSETLTLVKNELKDLGFYGFVNPLKMYQDFCSSRITRKVEVNIDETVVDFLTRIVRSGGVSVE